MKNFRLSSKDLEILIQQGSSTGAYPIISEERRCPQLGAPKSPKTKSIVSYFFVMLASCSLNGCLPIVVGTGTAMSGKIITQDKTIGEAISDSTIWVKIRGTFLKEGIDGLWGSINVTVNEGRVLITGAVKNKKDMVTILRIAWQQNSVKDVINEVRVADDGYGSHELSKYATDTWITGKIKSKMFVNANVRSVNYHVETIRGVVYLFGAAHSKKEMEIVENIAYGVKNVKEVKSYIKIKQGFKRKIKPLYEDREYSESEEDINSPRPVRIG